MAITTHYPIPYRYHIVVETPEGNLAQGMRQLNGVDTQMTNRMHGRVGHVFQGRYEAIMVEKDSDLLELARHVVLNPVRAGMVNDVDEWPRSSHPAMIGSMPTFDSLFPNSLTRFEQIGLFSTLFLVAILVSLPGVIMRRTALTQRLRRLPNTVTMRVLLAVLVTALAAMTAHLLREPAFP